MNDDNKYLLPLQAANAFQLTEKGRKLDWLVRKNITGETLASLPANISDQAMMASLNFARKYELEAFNIGIRFQKGKQNALMKEHINTLIEENERLAGLLEFHTKGEK